MYYGKEAWESVGGWSGFLGGKKRVPKYKEIQRASSAARLLEIADYADYRSRRTADPRLPSNPLDYYGKEAWESIGGWDGFLNRVTKYPTIEKASQASRRLGVSSWTEYCRRYKEDPLLPSVPSRFYGKEAWESIGGWDGFLNRVTKYPTIQEASQAVQSLGIIDYADYRSRREKDPRLPGNPWHYFGKEAWGLIGGWPGFLGRKPKKKG